MIYLIAFEITSYYSYMQLGTIQYKCSNLIIILLSFYYITFNILAASYS